MEGFMMNKSKLTSLQFSCLIFAPILSLFSGIGTYNIIKIAGVDAWISVILAFFLGLLLLLLFWHIFSYKPELNIIEKNKYLFGPVLGFILNLLINAIIFIIGILLLYNVSNFAISQLLAETPMIVFMILLGSVLIYNVSMGIENMSRVGLIVLAIIIFLTIISVIGVFPTIELSNIKPTLEYGFSNPLKGGLLLTLTNVVPIFVLLIVDKKKIIHKESLPKYISIFYTLAFLFAFIAIFFAISSLGIYLCRIYQYPEYTVLKKISLFNFIERVENFIYVKWLLNSFISLSLIIYHISQSIHKKSQKLLPTIVTVLLVISTLYIFHNNTIFYNIGYYVFPYLCLFLFLIYLIIGIHIFIRKLIEN